MMGAFDRAAEGFSRKAAVYDVFGQDHPNLSRMRAQVYAQLLEYVRPPARILEINAGTGGDAVFLAQQGLAVHATDIAPGMVASIRDKIARYELEGRLTVEQRSFTDLDGLAGGEFDGVFSNLGGLNCIEDLRPVARAMPRLLRRGGSVTWVVMPPFCLWETAALLRGDWRVATRRLTRGGTQANIEGVRVRTYYHSPRRVVDAFGSDFRVERLQGLSVFAPPADHKGFAVRHPRLYRMLVNLDGKLSARPPFRAWGDFFIITLRYEPRRK